MRFKVLIFGVVLFISFLFSKNLDYFKSIVHFKESHFGNQKHLDDSIKLNARYIFKQDEYDKQSSVGIIKLYMVPYLINVINDRIGKHYTYFSKKHSYLTEDKLELILNSEKYPILEIKIYSIKQSQFKNFKSHLKKNKITRFLNIDIEINNRYTLKDARFNTDKTTVVLGSLCERILEKKEFYFLKQLPNYKKYNIEISVKDLCTGNSRIKEGCVGNDLKLMINEGVVSEINEQSSKNSNTIYHFETNKDKKFKELMNIYKIKILVEKYNIKLYNIKDYSFSIEEDTVLKSNKYPIDDYILEAKIDGTSISLEKYYEYKLYNIDDLVKNKMSLMLKDSKSKYYSNNIEISDIKQEETYELSKKINSCSLPHENKTITCEIKHKEIKIFKTYKIKDKNNIIINFVADAKKINDVTYNKKDKSLKVLYTNSKLEELKNIEVPNTNISIGENIITLKKKKVEVEYEIENYYSNSDKLNNLKLELKSKNKTKYKTVADEKLIFDEDIQFTKCKVENSKKYNCKVENRTIIFLPQYTFKKQGNLKKCYLKKHYDGKNTMDLRFSDKPIDESFECKDVLYDVKVDNNKHTIDFIKSPEYKINAKDLKQLKKMGETITINNKDIKKLQFKQDEISSCDTGNNNIECEFSNNREIRLSKIFATEKSDLCRIYLEKIKIKSDNLKIYLADIAKMKTSETIKDNGKTYSVQINGSEIKIEEKKCEKIPLNIVNLDEFRIGSTYYVYLYGSKDSCEQDSNNRKSLKKFSEDFTEDIQGQKVCKKYIWIKGENFSSCTKAISSNKKLKFKVKKNQKKRLIIVEDNDYFTSINGLKAKIEKKIKKLKNQMSSQVIIMQSDGDYKISSDLTSFDCSGEQRKFSPFKSLNNLNDMIEQEGYKDIWYITAKKMLSKPTGNFGHIAMWRLGDIKVHIYSTKQNCKVWKRYATDCKEF